MSLRAGMLTVRMSAAEPLIGASCDVWGTLMTEFRRAGAPVKAQRYLHAASGCTFKIKSEEELKLSSLWIPLSAQKLN